MASPPPHQLSSYAYVANDLSTLFAPLLPRGPSDVRAFLFDAAYALGEKEADLARELGVQRATLSGWKARGSIPDQHVRWFSECFAGEVLKSRNPQQHEGFRHAGLELALALFEETNFDPFGLARPRARERVGVCYRYLGPISRLALFVLHRSGAPSDGTGTPEELEAATFEAVLPRLRGLLAATRAQLFC